MNPRDKHLLEVFKDLGEGEAPPPPLPPAAARGVRAEREPAARRPLLPLPPEARVRLLLAAAVLFAFLAGFFVGRAGGGREDAVRAADPLAAGSAARDPLAFLDAAPPREEGPAAGAPREAEPAPEGPSPEATATLSRASKRLEDPSNAYTVVAITYDDTDDNERLAWSTVYHFAERGLDVGPPYGRGGRLFILVGAAPTSTELVPLRDRVRVQLDPGGRRQQYESAYILPIDQVISDR